VTPKLTADKVLFFLLALICLAPFFHLPKSIESLVPPAALIVGMVLALTLGNPYPKEARKVSKTLLQAAVVLLGISLNLNQVVQAGERGLAFAVVSISLVFALGYGLQRLLKVRPMTSLLVSTGTAICGGSAIAAVSSALDAPQEDISVAVATVFLLNAVALIIFPPIGHALALTDQQFGTWAGIAIHDVSSVVGAASAFGGGAVAVATAVKLSRVLFLVPVTLLCAWRSPDRKGFTIPWFIGLFLIASLISTELSIHAPDIATSLFPTVKLVALAGFALSLYLIGGGLTRATLKAVGVKPMVQGVILWFFISVLALYAVKHG
jgi:uncharacterized integral membrane protein (TIGR00698 family)